MSYTPPSAGQCYVFSPSAQPSGDSYCESNETCSSMSGFDVPASVQYPESSVPFQSLYVIQCNCPSLAPSDRCINHISSTTQQTLQPAFNAGVSTDMGYCCNAYGGSGNRYLCGAVLNNLTQAQMSALQNSGSPTVCGAPVVPASPLSPAPTPAPGPPPPPSCPAGQFWTGTACVTQPQCPPGTRWTGSLCARIAP